MARLINADEKTRTEFDEWLWAPPQGRDPDHVPQSVIDEEMSLFHQAARQNGPGGG